MYMLLSESTDNVFWVLCRSVRLTHVRPGRTPETFVRERNSEGPQKPSEFLTELVCGSREMWSPPGGWKAKFHTLIAQIEESKFDLRWEMKFISTLMT